MRSHHPYAMYEAIIAQPDAFTSVISSNKNKINSLKEKLHTYKRIFLVGTGTSYHAALAGQYIFSVIDGNLEVLAVQAFNFALYTPTLSTDDCVIVISHRGTKKYSVESLELAGKAGAQTILITGKSKEIEAKIADDIFYTVEQEESGAHTVSYTSAIAILCALARNDFDAVAIKNVLQQCLTLEEKMKSLAQTIKDSRRVWIVGGGPSEITAQEIALKMKETSYTQAEGMGTETFFHGPFQSVEANDFFILIAPDGKAQERTLELIPAIKEVGAKCMVICNANKKDLSYLYEVPHVEEQYTTVTCVIPLQLLTYHLALVKQTNPDGYRLDDPTFAKAFEFMKL